MGVPPDRGTSRKLTLYGEIDAIESDVRDAWHRAEREGQDNIVIDALRGAIDSLRDARWATREMRTDG